VARAQDENGQAIAPAWSDTDTVLSFALDCEKRTADAGQVLRAARGRDLDARHAEHVASIERDRASGRRHIGAPDCWACWREYRADELAAWMNERAPAYVIPTSTLDENKVRKVREQARMRQTPHAYAHADRYGRECDTCAGDKYDQVHAEQVA
jgi:hypothetical protein